MNIVKKSVVVEITGPLNFKESEGVYKDLRKYADAQSFTIDMKNVNDIASSGLNILRNLQKLVRNNGGTFKLINVQPKVNEIFEITGHSDYFSYTLIKE